MLTGKVQLTTIPLHKGKLHFEKAGNLLITAHLLALSQGYLANFK